MVAKVGHRFSATESNSLDVVKLFLVISSTIIGCSGPWPFATGSLVRLPGYFPERVTIAYCLRVYCRRKVELALRGPVEWLNGLATD